MEEAGEAESETPPAWTGILSPYHLHLSISQTSFFFIMYTSEHQALQPSPHPPPTVWTPLVAQWQRIHLPMQETWVRSLGWEDPLEKEMATQCSILAPEIPWTEEPGVLQSQRVGQRLATELEGMRPRGYLVHVFVMYQGRAVQRLELFNICGFISVIVISSAH